MANGVSINEVQFRKMKKEDRDVTLFKNTEDIKKNFQDFQDQFRVHTEQDDFRFKLSYAGFAALVALFGLGKFFKLI